MNKGVALSAWKLKTSLIPKKLCRDYQTPEKNEAYMERCAKILRTLASVTNKKYNDVCR